MLLFYCHIPKMIVTANIIVIANTVTIYRKMCIIIIINTSIIVITVMQMPVKRQVVPSPSFTSCW